MQIPGTENRTTEDRDCEIRCSRGHLITTLRPGQAASLGKPGRRAEVTCRECGEKAKIGTGSQDGG